MTHLHNEDSGEYFCRVPVKSTFVDYYVTLTVLGMTGVVSVTILIYEAIGPLAMFVKTMLKLCYVC